jgi:hypothetical protein
MKIPGSDKTKSDFPMLFSTQGLLPLYNKFVSMSVVNTHFPLKRVLLNKIK